jgi:hypothetical protein
VTCPHADRAGGAAIRCNARRRVVHVGVCLHGCTAATGGPQADVHLRQRRMWECSQCNEYNGNICELRGGCHCSFGRFLEDPASRCPAGTW